MNVALRATSLGSNRPDQYAPAILQDLDPPLHALEVRRRRHDLVEDAVAAEDFEQLVAGDYSGVVFDAQRMIAGSVEDGRDSRFCEQGAADQLAVDGAEILE